LGRDCIGIHNEYRDRHGVPQLVYNSQLEKYAISRAEELAKTDHFAHPKNLPYGENLYYKKGRIPTCVDAVNAWYKEIKYYNYDSPRFSRKTGHFTQIVWKGTTDMGCASSQSPRTRRIYIVCNYYPPGNVRGQFKANVPYQSPYF
ncbi:hypothetical protein B4U79_05123, partial [Dinothrombium tinctorium]